MSIFDFELSKYMKIRSKIGYFLNLKENEFVQISNSISHFKKYESRSEHDKSNDIMNVINFLFSVVFFHSTDYSNLDDQNFKKDTRFPYLLEYFLNKNKLALIPFNLELENVRIINISDTVKYTEKESGPILDMFYE